MNPSQFRVLYREFLFRMVDLELLSPQAQGDMNKLFGQFAALLITVSTPLAIAGLSAGGNRLPPMQRVLFAWSGEHVLICITMLVVGLFAILSWDSTFPNKRDVMALGPLPIQSKTLFLSKIAGVAVALALTVFCLHSLAQLTWPGGLSRQPEVTFQGQSIPATGGFVSFLRTFAAYWITMFAGGLFIFCCVLGIQGITALLLPRRLYLQASSMLQFSMFCLFLCGFFLLPMSATPRSLAAAQGNGLAAWQFSWWFVGLFQQLKGSPALGVLTQRAWMGLGGIVCITSAAYSLAYFRMLRKIIEEPDIVSNARGARWLPSFGDSLHTAVGQFSVRSILRSRQHRMILAFYLGMGFGFNLFFLTALKEMQARTGGWGRVSAPILASTTLMLLFSVTGMRIVFALPLDLKANWIFRITPVRGGLNCLKARRRTALAIGLLPVLIGIGALLFPIWPAQAAAAHLIVLALVGAIITELCLQGFQKIPFTCSYLPGKTNIHIAVLFSMLVLLQFLNFCAGFELRAITSPPLYLACIVVLAGAVLFLRWRTAAQTALDDIGIRFEEEDSQTIQLLRLNE